MEAVEDGKNGYLIEVKNEESLYQAITRFIKLSYEEKRAMGLAGRARMEKVFDKNKVVDTTMKVIFGDIHL